MTPVAWGVRRASDGAIVSAFVNKENAVFGAAEIGGVDFDDGYQAVPLYAAPADRAMTEALAALADKTDALLDAVRKFVKSDCNTGLLRLNDAMVYARDAMLTARALVKPAKAGEE